MGNDNSTINMETTTVTPVIKKKELPKSLAKTSTTMYINPHKETCFQIEVEPTDTIADIKQTIENQEGIPIELIDLFKYDSSKPLDDDLKRYMQRYDSFSMRITDSCMSGQYYSRIAGTLSTHTPYIATCPKMKNGKTCDIYEKFIRYTYSEKGLDHMQLYSHHGLNIKNCKFGIGCKSYLRLVNNGRRLDDRCHVTVYSHPPRRNQNYESLDPNVYPFIAGNYEAFWNDLKSVWYERADAEQKEITDKFGLNNFMYPQKTVPILMKNKDLLMLLIDEINRNSNGSGSAKTGDWKLDLVTPNGNRLIDIVDKVYMNHPRHKKMGKPLNRAEMLSVVIYTGGECNYDLCKCQRNGDYRTWAVFDYCLNNAIQKLSDHEEGEYPLFSGVGNCQIDFKKLQQNKEKGINGYIMTTFVSTSYDINVAKRFLEMNGGKGVILGFCADYRKYARCADVSWISKFGESEKEVLIARQQHGVVQYLKFNFVDCIGAVERVCVTAWKRGFEWEKLF